MGKSFDLICVGMALVDSLIRGFDPEPVSAAGYRAVSGTLSAGGEAVNEAVAAAKLGLKAGIFCALGDDDAGTLVRGTLERSGVDTQFVALSPQTPVTTMFVREDGTRRSVTNQAHRYNFHPENSPERFTDARAVLLGSLFRAPFDDPEIIHAVVSRASEAGQLVTADTKLPNFRVLSLEDIRDSLPRIGFITPNEDEARYLTKKEDPEAMADVFLRYGVKNVIIKLGGRGCMMKNAAGTLFLPAYAVEAADATGAGDNFAAGFLSGILRGDTTEEALRFANACGAICASAVGAGTALRDREQVLAFMREHPL